MQLATATDLVVVANLNRVGHTLSAVPLVAADDTGFRCVASRDRFHLRQIVLRCVWPTVGGSAQRLVKVRGNVNRNTSADGIYYASVTQTKAHQARRRPKPLKLVEDEALCRLIGVWMDDGWSPNLISAMLAFHFGAAEHGGSSTGAGPRDGTRSPSRPGREAFQQCLWFS